MDWNLVFIAVCVVIILDISGVTEEIKEILKRWLRINGKVSIKPLDCSFCMTHWIGLIYLLFTGITLLKYLELLLICVFTPTIATTVLLLRDLLDCVVVWISKKLG